MTDRDSHSAEMSRPMPEGAATIQFAYPRDLARYVQTVWPAELEENVCRKGEEARTDPLPELPLLEKVLSTCYQASLLHEEGRLLRFRVMLRMSGRLRESDGPPAGLHRMIFKSPRPYTPAELRRLAPAADFSRSLIGIESDSEAGFHIWGVVHSGPRWMQERYGGRRPTCPLPGSLVVMVTGPGTLTVSAGSVIIARLEGGRVLGIPINIYASRWLSDLFAVNREEVWRLHEEARAEAVRGGRTWGRLDPEVVRLIAQHMLKRLVATIRDSYHGGLLVILPPEEAERIERLHDEGDGSPIHMKYVFREEEPRRRFRSLVLSLLALLAEEHPELEGGPEGRLVGWADFQESIVRELATHDEAILELAHQAAAFAATDGAVVMNKRFEVIGFGGEISSELPLAPTVVQSLDQEGEEMVEVATDVVGTRHRAAYRLVNQIRDALAIVVSQDGEVRFVAWKDGRVTFWAQ